MRTTKPHNVWSPISLFTNKNQTATCKCLYDRRRKQKEAEKFPGRWRKPAERRRWCEIRHRAVSEDGAGNKSNRMKLTTANPRIAKIKLIGSCSERNSAEFAHRRTLSCCIRSNVDDRIISRCTTANRSVQYRAVLNVIGSINYARIRDDGLRVRQWCAQGELEW